MSQPAKAQEPSMEEILASIRRIIADEDSAKPAPKPQPTAPLRPTPRRPAPPPPSRVSAPAPESTPPLRPHTTPGQGDVQSDVDAMLREFDTPPRAEPAAQEPEAILERTEPMTAPPPPPPMAPAPAASVQAADIRSDAIVNDRPPTPEPSPREDPPRRAFSPASERALLSSAATTAVDSAFSTLAHAVLVQNARTIEDLVHDMLQPMLKAWLDDNLPGMVERIVRAEIERVSRGRG